MNQEKINKLLIDCALFSIAFCITLIRTKMHQPATKELLETGLDLFEKLKELKE
jgi:hypothetical protein